MNFKTNRIMNKGNKWKCFHTLCIYYNFCWTVSNGVLGIRLGHICSCTSIEFFLHECWIEITNEQQIWNKENCQPERFYYSGCMFGKDSHFLFLKLSTISCYYPSAPFCKSVLCKVCCKWTDAYEWNSITTFQ